MLFRPCNLGPGLFEGDRFNNQTAALAVTFASQLSNCSRSWVPFIGLSETFQENTGTTPGSGLIRAGHTAFAEPPAEWRREGSVQHLVPTLNMLFRPCNLGPGLFEGDRFNDQAAALAVTFASHPYNCSRS
jgi:hypothetical protein